MQNFIKTIINAVQNWTKGEIRKSKADWNQNDASADNYVKNRTHWEEEKKKVLESEIAIEITEDSYFVEDFMETMLQEGTTYTINWDGVDYICLARNDGHDDIYIGNQSLSDGWEFPEIIKSNEPFFIGTYEAESWSIAGSKDVGSHTISITTPETVIHKLDTKYLPDGIGVQSDWNETDEDSKAYIWNKPDVALWSDLESVQTAADSAQATADLKMDATNPVGSGSFSMNRKVNSVVGNYSFVAGDLNTASGNYSTTFGRSNTASGSSSLAFGNGNTASGSSSLACGSGSTASKDYAVAFGTSNVASGNSAVAFGGSNVASGLRSYVEGIYNIAASKNQHVQGKFNIEDALNTYAHIVGNGESDTARSNAHTLDWDGNAWFAGDVYVGSTSGTNKDEGSKKLATEEYVLENADASGAASSAVSAHNTKTDAHNDIRLLINTLTTRLDALANSDDDTLDQMAEVVAYIKDNRELLEQVTTGKVSVSDIINNLTTNVANKPLSAAQGVALKALIDAIEVPTKVSELTNDKNYLTSIPSEYVTETELNAKGYLTQHQDISGKLDASKLPEAINTALSQAKASGDFDGADGQRGTGLLPVTTAPSDYTTAVGGITPKYRMAISTIKTQSGATEVLLGDTIRYSYYHYPIAYLDSSYAYCTTRTSIRGATGAAYTLTDEDKATIVEAVTSSLTTETWTFTLKDGSTVTKKVVLG